MKLAANTISKVLAQARTQLGTTSDEAALDAQVLMCECLDCNYAWIIAHGNEPIPAAALHCFSEYIRRRSAGEPLAYIIGQREFWSLALKVSDAVLIPRADTELLVERALLRVSVDDDCQICDLGTGSGAVALALASERPNARIIASDASDAALRLAQDNAALLGLTSLRFINSDWLSALQSQRFDVVVSNPPYIREDDPHLTRGDLRFEPRSALAAGIDGLDDLRTIIKQAMLCMCPGGWLVLEHGYDQGADVRALLRQHNYQSVETSRDLAGHERVTEAQYE